MTKTVTSVLLILLLAVAYNAHAANYSLEITQPQPSLTTACRYYKAYPGIEYKVPVGVFGGLYPFTYSLTTCPSGMTIDSSTGIITWSNPTTVDSPHNVTVSVTDAESTTVNRSWTITVTTTGFIFVDDSAGDGGNGTISSPFNSMVDFYGGTDYAALHDTTYQNYTVYWRAGTYTLEGYEDGSGQQVNIGYPITEHPNTWLAYPGETVTFNLALNEGRYLNISSWSGTYAYFQGITWTGGINHALRINGYPVVFDCDFTDIGPGVEGENSSCIFFPGNTPSANQYALISNCTFSSIDVGTGNAHTRTQGGTKQVYDSNTFTETNMTDSESIAIKAYTEYVDIRNNRFSGIVDDVLSGNWNYCNNLEIRYNLVLGADSTYEADCDYGGLTINHDGTAGVSYIHHNTIVGNIVERVSDGSDGPFNIYNNVFVNENSGTIAGTHINQCSYTTTSDIVSTNNLVCYAADGCIDANGLLQGSYRSSYLGIRGYELLVTTHPTLRGGIIGRIQ